MPQGVQVLSRATQSDALAYLSRAPFENVFLSWLIENDRGAAVRSSVYIYCDAKHVQGVAFFGRQVVLAAAGDAAVGALAKSAPSNRFERMIVGNRSIVECYWHHVRSRHAAPRIIRESQPLFALDRASLKARPAQEVSVRRARPSDWEIVAHNSAKMIEHELAYDPRSLSGQFNANVRMMIDRGLWWVGEYAGELCFFCNAGPRSSQTLQLQGIWTPPPLRGRGLAAAALAGICAELLLEGPSLSLYVNSFNERAIALYERTGFQCVGEFKTLLF